MIDPPGSLRYSGLAVFNEDKLIGWLNEKQSKGYSYIKDKVRMTVGSMPCPEGGKIALDVMSSKTIIKGKVTNGKPHIDIKIIDGRKCGRSRMPNRSIEKKND